MLVLSRLINEEVVIKAGDNIIIVKLVDIRGEDKARIGFTADRDVSIHRREIWDLIERERAEQAPIQTANIEVQPPSPVEP